MHNGVGLLRQHRTGGPPCCSPRAAAYAVLLTINVVAWQLLKFHTVERSIARHGIFAVLMHATLQRIGVAEVHMFLGYMVLFNNTNRLASGVTSGGQWGSFANVHGTLCPGS
jgi:hypothetical protein